MQNAATLNTPHRYERLIDELVVACRRAPNDELKKCAVDTAKLFARVAVRRVANIGRLFRTVGAGAAGAFKALRQGNQHELQELGRKHGAAVRAAFAGAKEQLTILRKAIQDNPSEALPRVMVGTLAFLAASGGPDADGGVPDLDLQLGIDAHRSVVFHSVIAGAVIETALFGLARIVGVVHAYLPGAHDPIWDAILRNKDAFLQCAAQGASAGIAYHLLVDGTVQAGTYHGLPFEMSAQAHQALFVANAAAEAADVPNKAQTFAGSDQRDLRAKARNPIKAILSDQKVEIYAWGAAPYLKEVLILDADIDVSTRSIGSQRTLHKKTGSDRMTFKATSISGQSVSKIFELSNIDAWVKAFLTGLDDEVVTIAIT